MDEALKPCPFCLESRARMYPPTCNKLTPYNQADRAFPIIRCACGAEMAGDDWDQSGRSAIARWNYRAGGADQMSPEAPEERDLAHEADMRELMRQQLHDNVTAEEAEEELAEYEDRNDFIEGYDGDDQFCSCSVDHGIEEIDSNQCDCCGMDIA